MFKKYAIIRNNLVKLLKLVFTGYTAFGALCVALFLVFLMYDNYREYTRSDLELHKPEHHLANEVEYRSRMFRAQRNIYLCGITVYLGIVLWGLVRYSEYSRQLEERLNKTRKAAKDGSIEEVRELLNSHI